MTKREIKTILTKVKKIQNKRKKSLLTTRLLESEGQDLLNNLAKKKCPFKRGQIFKATNKNVWVKLWKVTAANVRLTTITNEYENSPYQLECLRCSVKGVTASGKWIFFFGQDIGTKWEPIK